MFIVITLLSLSVLNNQNLVLTMQDVYKTWTKFRGEFKKKKSRNNVHISTRTQKIIFLHSPANSSDFYT